jgi:hypothetical protein
MADQLHARVGEEEAIMRPMAWVGALTVLAVGACGGTSVTVLGDASTSGEAGQDSSAADDGPSSGDASNADAPAADDGPNSCEPVMWPSPDGGLPPWAQGGCPEAGCPSGSMCVEESVACCARPLGCAPVSCGCTVCGTLPCSDAGSGVPTGVPGPSVICETPTESRRSAKKDIEYVDDGELDALAGAALEVRLARYRYKDEPKDARRRLGFIIDDQPNPSPAVLEDRAHVDLYGYASLLMATVQRQEKEIRALERRVESLEGETGRGMSVRR